MKKIFLAVLVVAATLGSCRKDYTCECTITNGTISATETTALKNTKKGAEENCDKGDKVEGDEVTECSIK